MIRDLSVPLTPVRCGPWSARPLPRFDASLEPLLNIGPIGFTSFHRSVENLNYMLDCPTVEFSAYLLEKGGTPRGYFVLSEIEDLVRIADIRIASDRVEEWQGAYGAATAAALERPDVCRIQTASSVPFLNEALERNGYRATRRAPLMLYDPKNLLSGAPPINFQLLEGDAAYYWEWPSSAGH